MQRRKQLSNLNWSIGIGRHEPATRLYASAASSSVSFRRNLFTRWQESRAQEGVASAEKDASCMTDMRSVASAQKDASCMTDMRSVASAQKDASCMTDMRSVASAQKDASCMTDMRSVASAKKDASCMTDMRSVASAKKDASCMTGLRSLASAQKDASCMTGMVKGIARFALRSMRFALCPALFALCALLFAPSASAQSKIFWNEQMGGPPNGTIYSSDLDGSAPDNLFPLNDLGPIRGLAVDPINKKVYWSDSTNNRIRSANFDGSGAATAIGSLVSNPASLAVDPGAGKIYWCSEGPGTEIFRADFDGSNMEELFDMSSVTHGIALDVAAGKMYFAIHDLGSKILRTDLDGANSEVLLVTSGSITSLGLDPDGGKMYWVDLGAAEIHRANLDGTSPELLVTGTALPHSIGVDAAAGKMYWSDLDDGNLFRANLDGSSVETLTPAMPNRPEFLGLYIAETSTFAGMTNTSLGGASMSLDLNNNLVISNIGASGLDGVSFFLGQAQFGELDFGSTLALSPGAFVQASAIGSLNNVPGQTIGTIRFTGVSGGNTNVQFDLSAVSTVAPCFIVYNGATQVFLGVVPGNSVEVAGHTGPCLIPFQPQSASGGGANALATVFLRQKLAISIPGGPTVTGDRIVALAENISTSVEYVSDISVIGANLSSFTLEAEALGLFNTNLHEAVGSAQITSTQQLATSQLTVSNLGASLLDGVDIDVEEAGTVHPCFLVGLAAVPLSGVNEQVHFSASSPAIADFGAVDLLATGSGFNVNVDYSPIGASMVEVMVFNAGVPVGSALVPAGNVGTITPASGPIALTRTFVEAAGSVSPCFLVGFRSPVGFAFGSLGLGAEGGGQGAESFAHARNNSPLEGGSGGVGGDVNASSNVSFRRNLFTRWEESQAQEGGASAEKDASSMTEMGGGASAEKDPFWMTDTEDAATSSSVSFRRKLFTRSEESQAQEGDASAEKDPFWMTDTDDVAAPSSVSFRRKLFTRSEESQAQEGDASAEKDASSMTEMGGGASAEKDPFWMTVMGGAENTPPNPPQGGNIRGRAFRQSPFTRRPSLFKPRRRRNPFPLGESHDHPERHCEREAAHGERAGIHHHQRSERSALAARVCVERRDHH